MTLTFSRHATERMFERRITRRQVEAIIATGDTIEAYPDRQPVPSFLVLGWIDARPLHVVYVDEGDERIVVTVYDPSEQAAMWSADFRKRVTK